VHLRKIGGEVTDQNDFPMDNWVKLKKITGAGGIENAYMIGKCGHDAR